jgi:hypothetical protein
MDLLSREECLAILELSPDADQYKIENRYTMLVKRYRGLTDSVSREKMEKISLAYNILTGRYVEPEPQDPRLETMVFGKSRRQWRNIWHYSRIPFLLGLVGAIILGYFLYTIITNKPPDFQIAFVGNFGRYGNVEKNVEDYIIEMFPDFESVEVLTLPMDLSSIDDPQTAETEDTIPTADGNLYNYMMKMLTMIAGDSYEIFVCDRLVFDRYAREGAFDDITELYASWRSELPDQVKPLRRRIDVENDERPIAIDPADNFDLSLPILGLDVTALNLTPGLGIYGDTQILTIGIRASAREEAVQFLKNWMLDSARMHERQAEHETAMAAESAD